LSGGRILHDGKEQIMEIRGGKRFRTKTERRQIVEETLKPGASVSQVARVHDVNANQVFHWRRQYRQGWFDEVGKSATALVPVKVVGSVVQPLVAKRRGSKRHGSSTSGSIDVDLGHARVRIEGAADPECVRVTLEGLIR
jgi:transposase